MSVFKVIARALGSVVLLLAGLLAALSVRFYLGRRRVARLWASAHHPPLDGMGAVEHLTILPLVDRKAARSDLASEPGVSYLVHADHTTILFDVGMNLRGEHPSPLLRNMQALGVTLEQVGFIVISHLHQDHVGGPRQQLTHTFDLSSQPVDLGGRFAFVPRLMTHPTARVEVVDSPRLLAPGVATLGPIPRQLFVFGRTLEQSLAIDVEGKGIVLIIGCGHPTLQWIVEQAERLFNRPVYGIVGGLHYPVTGLPVQRYVGTNNYPWNPVSKEDVNDSIEFLRQRHLGVVAISPHDSCDWTLEAFHRAFPEAYQELLAGKEISV